ncbi:MAG: sugar phosphate isomerase/epimerase family protein [Phycisphaeraceae bacterium]
MAMIPGMWTSFLIEHDPEQMVRAFARAGWRNLELSTEHGAALLERGDGRQVGQRFRVFAEAEGVRFPQGHLWLHADIVSHDQSETLDTLRRWLDLFVTVGVRAAVLHPGGRALQREGIAEERIAEMRTAALRTLADHVRDTELTICLENAGQHKGSAQALVEMIALADRPNLGICLDTGHLHLTGGDQAEFIRTAGPLLKALHIADNEGQTDQHLMPFGRGTVAWDVVTRELNALPYERLFNFEIPGENRCPLPVRLAKLDYLKTILPILLGDAAGADTAASPGAQRDKTAL